MACLQFTIKIIAVYFVNSVHDNTNWDKIYNNLTYSETKMYNNLTQKIHIWSRMEISLRVKKLNADEVLRSKLRYIGQIYYTVSKHMGKKIEERI